MSPVRFLKWLLTFVLLAVALPATAADPVQPPPTPLQISGVEALDNVWSGHSVRFALLVTARQIVVGYYDANRQLTIASRPLRGGGWVYQKLDSWTGWDSHNYIALAEDAVGRLHITANMHSSPLTAYRSDQGGDILTLQRVPVLVDPARERVMTYPIYLQDLDGRLILKYRDGRSGNGVEIYNVLDAQSGRWSRLTDAPLTDGEGRRNAYFMGPVLGPDRQFHIAWVWRDTPMAETNHDLSYARSPDLVHWFTSDGKPLALPIRLSTAEIVDPVPVRGGMINNNTVIGFDDQGRVMITYHKYDQAGNTQIYVARREASGWQIVPVSRWQGYRWDFGGGGSLNSELFVSGAVSAGKGLLRVPVVRLGQSIDFLLRSSDLSLVEEKPVASLSDQLRGIADVPPGMEINLVDATTPDGATLALVWAARPPQRDLPSADIPAPTVLRLVTVKKP